MAETEASSSPECVGIIMDGNRRWAKLKGLPVFEGHRIGYQTLREIVRASKEAGVKNLIVYAFSSENWKRAGEEVGYLMDLFRFVLNKEFDSLHKEGIRLKCLGDISKLPEDIRKDVARVEEMTAANSVITLGVCMSYGGREEVLRAVKKLLAEGGAPEELTEERFSAALDTSGIPDPDLIIRTSGEERLSGFLPWQSVYSELFFTGTLWPDFSPEEYSGILKKFAARSRRHGK